MPSTSALPQRTNRLAKVCLALRRALKLDDWAQYRGYWAQYRGYRPEKHYMRGPGPKSRSRHADRDHRSTSR